MMIRSNQFDNIAFYNAIFEGIQAFKNVIDNPALLKKLASEAADSVRLTEQEKLDREKFINQANESKTYLNKEEALRLELENLRASLLEQHSLALKAVADKKTQDVKEVEDLHKALDARELAIKEKEGNLINYKSELDNIKSSHDEREKAQDIRDEELGKREKVIQDRENKIAEARKALGG